MPTGMTGGEFSSPLYGSDWGRLDVRRCEFIYNQDIGLRPLIGMVVGR